MTNHGESSSDQESHVAQITRKYDKKKKLGEYMHDQEKK
jgi:hypothetical protein